MAEIEESGFKRMFPRGDIRVYDRRPPSEIIWASHFAFVISPDEADIRVLKDRVHGGRDTSVTKALAYLKQEQDVDHRIVFFTERSPFRARLAMDSIGTGFQPGQVTTLFGATSRGRSAVTPSLEFLLRRER